MKEIDTISLEEIAQNLLKCAGIKIFLFRENYRKATLSFDVIATFLRKEIRFNQNYGDRAELKFKNGSEFYVLPAFEDFNSMCGCRANQIVIGKELLSNQDFIQTIAMPLLSVTGGEKGFRTDIFLINEN